MRRFDANFSNFSKEASTADRLLDITKNIYIKKIQFKLIIIWLYLGIKVCSVLVPESSQHFRQSYKW